MSRAFVKEDVEPPERSTRRRSSSGLPPGALNYLTAAGAEQLRQRLAAMQRAEPKNADAIAELESSLGSATIVEPQPPGNAVAFGATVSLQSNEGRIKTHRVVGVDEVELDPANVSWVSEIGKALLSATLGQRLRLPGDEASVWTVVSIT